jgi:hypothetical protein
MTLPVAKKAHTVEAPVLVEASGRGGDRLGWDPYEVWRTRVLLPRLAAAAAAEPKTPDSPTYPWVPRL